MNQLNRRFLKALYSKTYLTDRQAFLVLILLPILIFLCTLLFLSWDALLLSCLPEGDYALIALSVEQVFRDPPLSGAYSRTGVRHPGPGIYYFYAVVSPLFSPFLSPQGTLMFSQFLLNVALLVTAMFLYRRQEKHIFSTAVLLLLSFTILRHANSELWFNIWGPAVVVLPIFLFLIASASVACGSRLALIPQGVSAVIAAGTHFGTIVLVLPLLLFSVVFFLIEHRDTWKRDLLRLLILPAICFLAFSPALIDFLIWQEQSNPYRLIQFFGTGQETNSLFEAIRYVAAYYNVPLRPLFGRVPREPVFVFLIVALILYRPGSLFRKRLKYILLFSIALSVFAALRVDELRYRYFMWWQFCLVLLVYAQLITAAGEKLIELIKGQLPNNIPIPVLCLSVLIMYASAAMASQWYTLTTPQRCAPFYKELEAKTQPLGINDYAILIQDNNWKPAAAVVYSLYKQGKNPCVYDRDFLFGREFTCIDGQELSKDEGKRLRLTFYDRRREVPEDKDATQHRGRQAVVVIKKE